MCQPVLRPAVQFYVGCCGEEEAAQAVALANAVPGVRTVVNRMEIDRVGRPLGMRRPLDEDELESTFLHQEGRVGGMGRRRQGGETEPDRNDDSQANREDGIASHLIRTLACRLSAASSSSNSDPPPSSSAAAFPSSSRNFISTSERLIPVGLP